MIIISKFLNKKIERKQSHQPLHGEFITDEGERASFHLNWEQKDLSASSLSKQRTSSHQSNLSCCTTRNDHYLAVSLTKKKKNLACPRSHSPSFRGAHTIGVTVMEMFTPAEPNWLPATRMDCCYGCEYENIYPFPTGCIQLPQQPSIHK